MVIELPEPEDEPEPEPEPSGDMPPPRPPARSAVGTGGPDEPPSEDEMIRYLLEQRARKSELSRLLGLIEDLWLRRIE